jgi:tRNA pseudouridine55 synthase
MNGVLIIDKPEGLTSHDVVGRVRRILKTRSVGHTGTLDPFATGVLVVLIGKATRLAQFLDKAEKEYLATIQFGYETDTGDRTGLRIADCGLRIEEIAARITVSNLEKALVKFRGETLQTPPMYSAKKVGGKKLYELARKGVEIERQPVKIKISELKIVENSENQSAIRNPQSAIVRVACSAGTYIRVLAEDIGKELGTGAHLAELRRTRAGSFDLRQAVNVEELEKLAVENNVEQILISPHRSLAHLPEIVLSDLETEQTKNGRMLAFPSESVPNLADKSFVRLADRFENLIAVGVFDAEKSVVQPRTVLSGS